MSSIFDCVLMLVGLLLEGSHYGHRMMVTDIFCKELFFVLCSLFFVLCSLFFVCPLSMPK